MENSEPFFTDQVQIKSKITLIKKKVISKQGQVSNRTEKIISDDKAIAKVFNKFFINIVPNLKTPVENNIDHGFTKTDDLALNAINKFKNHPSIIMIKRKNNPCGSFSFSSVQYDDILKKTKNLDTAKASQESDIPRKILKANREFFAQYFCENINYCIYHSILSSNLKSADVTPVYRKNPKKYKENYRPTSILSNVSKIYERCLYDQMRNYFKNILSKYQCGFRKGYNAQHCLIAFREK